MSAEVFRDLKEMRAHIESVLDPVFDTESVFDGLDYRSHLLSDHSGVLIRITGGPSRLTTYCGLSFNVVKSRGRPGFYAVNLTTLPGFESRTNVSHIEDVNDLISLFREVSRYIRDSYQKSHYVDIDDVVEHVKDMPKTPAGRWYVKQGLPRQNMEVLSQGDFFKPAIERLHFMRRLLKLFADVNWTLLAGPDSASPVYWRGTSLEALSERKARLEDVLGVPFEYDHSEGWSYAQSVCDGHEVRLHLPFDGRFDPWITHRRRSISVVKHYGQLEEMERVWTAERKIHSLASLYIRTFRE